MTEPVALQNHGTVRAFYQVLANTAIANVTSSYLWWALTFWAYLETRSVLATAIIGGSYMLLVAVFGVVFGVIVDRTKKKAVMVLSSMITLVTYLLAGALYLSFPESVLVNWGGPWFWVFAGRDPRRRCGREPPQHRALDDRHAARARRSPRPRERARRCRPGHRVHGDERVLGPVDRVARHGMDRRDRHRRDGSSRSATCSSCRSRSAASRASRGHRKTSDSAGSSRRSWWCRGCSP